MSAGTVVIGGTGFIGSRLVGRLSATRDEVVVISREGRWRWGATPAGVRVLACDVGDPGQQARLVETLGRATQIVNLAGVLFRPAAARGRYGRTHVEGTHRILAALDDSARADAGVRLVHVSTAGVLGPTGQTPRDESTPPAPATEYERTKLAGERAARAAQRPGLEVVIARPGLVYGPRDLHLLAWFRAIAKGRFRPVAGGRALWQPIHVDDVARAIESLLAAPAMDGQVFHFAGAERVTVSGLANRIADTLGTRRPRGSIPFALAYAAGAALEAAAAPFSADPPLSRSRARTLTEDRVYAIERAERLLGFRPEIPLDRGLAETVAWYRAEGLLS